MENRAHFVFIGAAVLAFVAALALFVVWKMNTGSQEELAYYRIYFDGDVQGLTADSPVYYRGIRLGRVTRVAIGSRDVVRADGTKRALEKVVVTIAIKYEQQIRENSYALFERPLVAGESFIQIVAGPDGDPPKPRKKQGEEPYPEIQPGTTFIQATVTSAQEVLAKIGTTIDRINTLLSEDNIKAINQTLSGLAALGSTLENSNADIRQAVGELPKTLAQVRTTMETLTRIGQSLDLTLADIGPQDDATKQRLSKMSPSELKLTLVSMRGAVDNINKVADSMNKLIADNRAPLRQFSQEGLNEFSQMIRELRALTANLNVISTRIERDPTGFVFGGKQGYSPNDKR
jgi:phospholipid/cholesterol/gamma-HCH transport system substrate-binding protein